MAPAPNDGRKRFPIWISFAPRFEMSESFQPANDAEPVAACGGANPENDPEIAALLDFEPVPRAYKQRGAWTPELQRTFIARLAVTGSVNKSAEDLGKDPGGIRRLRKAPGSDSFRASWDAAEELWERRNPAPPPEPFDTGRRRRQEAGPAARGGEGQRLNEYGEWEDEESLHRRADEARDSISRKLLNCRRLYLQEISANAGKRAAFELLTGFPIDWDRAARLQPQEDEPWRKPNMRQPDMLLTAENGWLGGMAHGPDKMADLRDAIDAERAEQGLDPVDWSAANEEEEEG